MLAQGPIRVMFELIYDAWDAGGAKGHEIKRVTLDAGSHFNRFDLAFRPRRRQAAFSPPACATIPVQAAKPTPARARSARGSR